MNVEPTGSAPELARSGRSAAVVVAAGRSTRMAGLDKQFALAGGQPLLARAVEAFEQSPLIDQYVIVLNRDNLERGRELALASGWRKSAGLVVGGARRQDSVWNGLQALAGGPAGPPEWVLVHDGARPFVTPEIVAEGLAAAVETGAAVAAVPVKDTIKLVESSQNLVQTTPPREKLWAVQTPQVFRYELLRDAHLYLQQHNLEVTDDAQAVESYGGRVKVFMSEYTNIKITTPEDLRLAQAAFGQAQPAAETGLIHPPAVPQLRVGQGFDVHRLAEGRPLILGGVTIPYERGLDGHSDADVLTHAIINALLGAAGLGDIGRHFPPTDPAYKGIASLAMLERVYTLLQAGGWQIVNIDATVAAQQPRLAPHIEAMRFSLAAVLKLETGRINIKATTTEKLGFVGRQEGLEGQAIALLQRTG